MIAFIDDHRDVYGVEPICRVLPIAPIHLLRPRRTTAGSEAGIEPSVGSVGDSYDNALAETIKGLYKAEVIHRRGPWRSFEAVEVEYATLEWVDWFNHRRLLEPIGNIPPVGREQSAMFTEVRFEARAKLFQQAEEQCRLIRQPPASSGNA
jgi:transposase InsO family protein